MGAGDFGTWDAGLCSIQLVRSLYKMKVMQNSSAGVVCCNLCLANTCSEAAASHPATFKAVLTSVLFPWLD